MDQVMQREILKDLIKPRRVETEATTERYGKFVIGPLERGYGTTIGNSLRRILLSSIPGAAIVKARMDNVKHEFSSIPGCVEDVTEIVLNLKDIVLELDGKEEAVVRLDVQGPAQVKAGMIAGDANVKVVNPDLHVASLNEEGKLALELIVKKGRGYVASEFNKAEEDPLGTIVLDAIFSPVRKVNHTITNARVGQRTDYDKLTLEIWTDGSISPDDALRGAASILKDQLNIFTGLEEGMETIEISAAPVSISASHSAMGTGSGEPQKFHEGLYRRIDEIELSVRSSNCLENANIKYIGELVQKTEQEMLRTKNFGRKSLNEIKEILTEMGLGLGMRLEGFPSRAELDKISEAQAQNSTLD